MKRDIVYELNCNSR